MARLLYLHPSNVPPPVDPFLDKFHYISEVIEGDVLSPVWWASEAEAKREMGERYPVSQTGRFLHHVYPGEGGSGWQKSLRQFWFFVTKGLELHRHNPYDIIMVYGTNIPGLAGVVLKLITGAKLIPELPNVPHHQYLYTRPHFGIIGRIKKALSDALLHLVIFHSEVVKLLYPTQLEKYPLLRNRKSIVFHDLVPIRYIATAPQPIQNNMILVVGFPWFTKGVDVLIRAFVQIAPEFPNHRLVILGHILNRTYLDQLAAGCDRIEFRKAVPLAEALKTIASCGIYVSASRTEGIARVLLEAMAAARPIVASATGGTPFLIGDTGILFRSEDPNDLANALRKMLSNPEMAAELGRKAHDRVMSEFDENAYVRQFAQMIEKATGAPVGSVTASV